VASLVEATKPNSSWPTPSKRVRQFSANIERTSHDRFSPFRFFVFRRRICYGFRSPNEENSYDGR
jgi:hypothetical protein